MKKNTTVSIYEHEGKILDNFVKDTNWGKSRVMKWALQHALSNAEQLDEYISKRCNNSSLFNPEKDGFGSINFIRTFVDSIEEKLLVNIIIRGNGIIIQASRGVKAQIIYGKGEQSNAFQVYDKDKKMDIKVELTSIKEVCLFDFFSGVTHPYIFITEKRWPSHLVYCQH